MAGSVAPEVTEGLVAQVAAGMVGWEAREAAGSAATAVAVAAQEAEDWGWAEAGWAARAVGKRGTS